MSTPTPPEPYGQNHDREEPPIDRRDGRSGTSDASSAVRELHELDSESDDAMDTTPDMTPHPDAAETHTVETTVEAAENFTAPPTDLDIPPAPISVASPRSYRSTPVRRSARSTPVPHSPRPDAAPSGPSAHSEDDSESDTEDEDDDYIWQPIPEDMTPPDEVELREIERVGGRSALDQTHWEKQTFATLEDPEHAPADTGLIDWTVENFNGTAARPNRDLLMRSPKVQIGGYDWRIKLYPRGNDSDYLSVYLECASLSRSPGGSGGEVDASSTVPNGTSDGPFVHHPLPALPGNAPVEAEPAVPAQVSVIAYNPANPTVWHFHCARHRFTKASADWGWTRFCGPRRELGMRMRTRRAPLLQNDTLAFRAMIRIVDDQTGVLWEHGPGVAGSSAAAADSADEDEMREAPVWDSVKMTGLAGLTTDWGRDPNGWDRPRRVIAYGGNLVAAVSAWMLFKPFREFLYGIPVPDPTTDARARGMPVVVALQKILLALRTPKAGAWPVSLEPLQDAWAWYGLDESIEKWDVVEVWEMIRCKLVQECALVDPHAPQKVAALLGDWSGLKPATLPRSLRVTIRGRISVQNALNKTLKNVSDAITKPQLLSIELQRQHYDEKKRSWVRATDRVKVDERISLDGTGYALYGLIAHKGGLQSGNYYSVLRPEGPETKWYAFYDERENSKVTCLTRRQAVDAHEGWKSSDRRSDTDPIAYVALYVRDDVSDVAFDSGSEATWDVPQWIINESEKPQRGWTADGDVTMLDPVHIRAPPTVNGKKPKSKETRSEKIEFRVISSKAFGSHSGPGIIDLFDPQWSLSNNNHVYQISVKATATPKDIRKQLARTIEGVSDPEQCRFWMLDSYLGTELRPTLLPASDPEVSCGLITTANITAAEFQAQSPERTIWVHVTDRPRKSTANSGSRTPNVDNQQAVAGSEAPPESAPVLPPPPPNEDTVMSDAPSENDPNGVPPTAAGPVGQIGTLFQASPTGGFETWAPPPPIITGTLVTPPPLPPTVRALMAAAMPPVPTAPLSFIDDVYFFVKVFDHNAQQLRCHGSYVAKKQARVDVTILKVLGLTDKNAVKFYEEDDLGTATPIQAKRRTFSQAEIQRGSIIIVHPNPPNNAQKRALAERGAFAEPEGYLQSLIEQRNFPDMASGTFTYEYFSAEQYEGEVRFRIPHGHGKRVYFSGDIYEGAFALGKRCGRGVMVYANGDRYEGEWLDDLKDGHGTFVEASTGNTYEGGWKNDRRFGEGVTRWKVAQEMERMCRVCWEETADAAFYDCGHVVACLPCAQRMDNCPVCRKRVVNSMKLYYVS